MHKKPRTQAQMRKAQSDTYGRLEDAMNRDDPAANAYRAKMHKIAQYKPAALTYGKKKTDEERRD